MSVAKMIRGDDNQVFNAYRVQRIVKKDVESRKKMVKVDGKDVEVTETNEFPFLIGIFFSATDVFALPYKTKENRDAQYEKIIAVINE